MFELVFTASGRRYLKYVDRKRLPGERGLWVEIGRRRDPDIKQIVETNRRLGLQVEIDERDVYRALVLKD